jgi:hypothetical protein
MSHAKLYKYGARARLARHVAPSPVWLKAKERVARGAAEMAVMGEGHSLDAAREHDA